LRHSSDMQAGTGTVGAAPIVYTEEDLARLLAEVERRSGRHRRHQRRAVQVAAWLVVALVAWQSSPAAASGEVRSEHHAAAVAALDVGRTPGSGA
jgi:hypothetical protein